ncbi:MAG: hypothetical protein NZ901_12645 [Geminocystis sp.]|nr:hypothetical protein [Geminocystis sp.]MCS7149016.1 hypothetical protein [Geminocystis sp.]MCX8078059.1 hypothetical protein [Geminocystis sp.]HIK37800.1 hypothetical protein [Geminocystis sp. M7585_C2015_104]
MARRKRNYQKAELELFPFLSVLACTIGSLILLIIVISSQTLSSGPQVTIIAKAEVGNNQRKNPRYIECRENGVVVYPSGKFVPVSSLNTPDSALLRLINEVKLNREKEYIIVAVRPKGIGVFQKVRDIIEREKVDIGYEPIDEDWKLNIR